MTLSLSHPNTPVFDQPSGMFLQNGFTSRRLLTIAAKPVLSDRNIPVKPSTAYKYRKCYISDEANLYKKTDEKVYERIPLFEAELKYLKLDYSKTNKASQSPIALRQPGKYWQIQSELDDSINSIIGNFDEPDGSRIPKRLLPRYSKEFRQRDYPAFLPFEPQCYPLNSKDTSRTDKIEYSTIGHIQYLHGLIKNSLRKAPIQVRKLSTILSPAYLFDKTVFSLEARQCFKFFEITNALVPFDITAAQIGKQSYREENCELVSDKHYLSELSTKIEIERTENYRETENLKKFLITLKEDFVQCFVEKEKLKASYDTNAFVTRIKPPKKIRFRANSLNIPIDKPGILLPPDNTASEKMVADKPTIGISAFISIKILRFIEKAATTKTKALLSAIYRGPNLVYKQTIESTTIPPVDNSLRLLEKSYKKQKLTANIPDRLPIEHQEITFKHISPESFLIYETSSTYTYQLKYQTKKSYFINPCPQHNAYTLKAMRMVKCAQAFKDLYRLKFPQNEFCDLLPVISSPREEKFVIARLEDTVPQNIAYAEKITKSRLRFDSPEFTNIELSGHFASLTVLKKYPNRFIPLTRKGITHRTIGDRLFIRYTARDRQYRQAKLLPAKRIIPKKYKMRIRFVIADAEMPKAQIHGFANASKRTDVFNTICTFKANHFGPYIPKEAAKNIGLPMAIIAFRKGEKLKQNHIVPPPGWNKEKSIFNCQIYLGPHPFGFPNFKFKAPKYSPLTTKVNFRIEAPNFPVANQQSRFILTKPKLYLSELSMKAPRRLLHPSITAKNSPREYFKSSIEEKPIQLTPLAQPVNLWQTWQFTPRESMWVCCFKPKYRVQMPRATKAEGMDNKLILLVDRSYRSKVPTSCNTRMPKINKFLLRSNMLEAFNKIARNNLDMEFIKTGDTLPYEAKIEKNICFRNRSKIIRPEMDETIYFTYELSEVKKSLKVAVNPTGLLRSFYASYKPDLSTKCLNVPKEYKNPAKYNRFDWNLQEIPNAFEFSFGSKVAIEENHNEPDKQSSLIERELSDRKYIEPEKLYPTETDFCDPEPIDLAMEDLPAPTGYRQTVTMRFFRINDISFYRLGSHSEQSPGITYTICRIPKSVSYQENNFADEEFSSLESYQYCPRIISFNEKSALVTQLPLIIPDEKSYCSIDNMQQEFSSLPGEEYLTGIANSFKVTDVEAIKIFALEEPESGFKHWEYKTAEKESYESISIKAFAFETTREFPIDYLRNRSFEKKADFAPLVNYKASIIEPEFSICKEKLIDQTLLPLYITEHLANFKLEQTIRTTSQSYRPIYLPDWLDMKNPKQQFALKGLPASFVLLEY